MPVGPVDRRDFLRAALAGLGGLAITGTGIAGAAADPEEPGTEPPTSGGQAQSTWSGVPPVSLAIPGLGVEAKVVGVALDYDGTMSSPPDPDQVAWYTLGPGMGVGGNVVFAGHIEWAGRPRVFGRLAELRRDDAVLVVDALGNGYEYVVEWSRWVRAEGAPIEEIFAPSDGSTITLITCGGEYRAETREYLDRFIVRARGS